MIITPNHSDTPTYVVCGTPFSGTSLVAGTLRTLGVYFGDEFTHYGTHQDVELSLMRTASERFMAVKQRNQTHFSWGFKSVNMRHWLPEVFPYLRNPIFLYCSRGLAETLEKSTSIYRQDEQFADMPDLLAEAAFLNEFLLTNAVPWCLLKFGTEPQDLLDQIIAFTGIEARDEQLEAALAFNNPRRCYMDIA